MMMVPMVFGYWLAGASDSTCSKTPACQADLGQATPLLCDRDNDGIADATDNCVDIANPRQIDAGGDGFGNACDQDLNDDGIVNLKDIVEFQTALTQARPDADFNGDNTVDIVDYAFFSDAYLMGPGPRGTCVCVSQTCGVDPRNH